MHTVDIATWDMWLLYNRVIVSYADIDEFPANCRQVCINTVGSYRCIYISLFNSSKCRRKYYLEYSQYAYNI